MGFALVPGASRGAVSTRRQGRRIVGAGPVNSEKAMLRSRSAALFPLPAILLALAACGGEDPVEPEPEQPPDLTGAYTLESLSAIVTGGQTLTPPDASGSFSVRQTSVTGPEASGTTTISVTLPDGLGGSTTLEDQGTYVNRLDGTWEQAGVLLQGIGTYTLRNNILTVEVTEPALNVSTTVWRRN